MESIICRKHSSFLDPRAKSFFPICTTDLYADIFALPKGFPCSEGKRNIRAQIHEVYLQGKACFVALLIASLSKRKNAK